MIDNIYWKFVLHFSFQGWYFHFFCFSVLLLVPHSEYLFQLFSHPLPHSSTFCISFLKLIHLFLHCAKGPLWGNQKHWRKSQFELNSDTRMSFQPSWVGRNNHFGLKHIQMLQLLQMFSIDRPYGELSCSAWLYPGGKLYIFSKFKCFFCGYICLKKKWSNVFHSRKHFFFSFVAYQLFESCLSLFVETFNRFLLFNNWS